MSERGRAAVARKGPAKLGEDLDDVFAAKKESALPPSGGATGRDAGGRANQPEPAPVELAEKGDTLTTLFFKGLTKLGIKVEPGDLVPKRQRRSR